MDKVKVTRHMSHVTRLWFADALRMLCMMCFAFVVGCATAPKQDSFGQVANDLRQNPESRDAVQKIMGTGQDKPVIKYSPVTGKHYSGDLEFDPETGARLEIVPND